VALALVDTAGKILMQQRLCDADHAGLWEFPGGKVNASETLEQALIREIEEELGVQVRSSDLVPVCFASDSTLPPAPRNPHVIFLYTARIWSGEVQCHAAQSLGWFVPTELASLEMPPLDVPLAKALLDLLQRG